MRRDGFANDGPDAAHEIEHTLRQADLVDDLRENERIDRRDLARLEHDGAPDCERGRDLRGDLMQRIVPRRDATDDSHGLAQHEGVAYLLLEGVLTDECGVSAEV